MPYKIEIKVEGYHMKYAHVEPMKR
uniref:Uncharacterized protein n=1 Tax=Rhizophora mucronata TaxID=61149 RepID=A0A2P2NLY1_RHIMU